VGSIRNINDSLVNALVVRMAKAQVAAAIADKEMGDQTQRESNDLLAAANDEQTSKVVNG
jgi:RecA/RadA recombinase